MERTLVIVKPDGVESGRVCTMLSRFEDSGLRLVDCFMTRASRDRATAHYAPAFEGRERLLPLAVTYILEGRILVCCWEGEDAVATARRVAGDRFDPAVCEPGTIRREFATDTVAQADAEGRAIRNLIHTSANLDDARRELVLWFPDISD